RSRLGEDPFEIGLYIGAAEEEKGEMKKGQTPSQTSSSADCLKNPTNDKGQPVVASGLSRRKFMLTSGAAAATFTIVPRHVLGGAGFVPPSEKVTLAYIGCGTQ